ncbi:MAG: polysaccharide biosynthesis protein [Halobacteriovoraceae bacterium]|jgi:FlaA1/EpsC-like NDP-sugar epimerase|nr:polysaccharide biosynthesis protein [Halobacteriovoraceae bacterium]
MLERGIDALSSNAKSMLVFAYDIIIVVLTFFMSYELRLGQVYENPELMQVILNKCLIIAPVQLACFYFMGLYRAIWRFSSTPDLIRIIKGVSIGIPSSFLVLFLFQSLGGVPRSIFFIQWAMLLIGVGGGRFAYRLYRDILTENPNVNNKRIRRTLILGAGHAAQMLIRDIKSDPRSDIQIVGLLDDDKDKSGKILQGFKVLGTIKDAPEVSKKYKATEVIITIPSATKKQLNRIVTLCNDAKLKVQTIPRLADILSGKFQITKLRKVTASDLLGRDQVELNIKAMSSLLTDKIVLVTGAGGSIGSELCYQIIKFKPKKIICYDIGEYNLYELEYKLKEGLGDIKLELIIGDVRDQKKAESVFKKFKPNIVFHAAAYKHVPMMELNPLESIKVNVLGTQVIADLADKYQLERFVLISTDKAVNPTNVMGTTKRIAEMICQSVQKKSDTKYSVVRFGNVLGSSGSVIPRFRKQIEAGGPVTVTHPDIIRYFMSISEAAQLVIQAAAIGNGGEVFVLDMGEPIKIVNLAKQMISLAGYSLGDDIEIEFTGLRPGEKLFEELLMDSESTVPTDHIRVRAANVRPVDDKLLELVLDLFSEDEELGVRDRLKKIVPEYEIPINLQ